MDTEKKKNRIGWGMIVVLIISAGFVDLANMVPILGGLVTTAYWSAITWYLWKTKHGLFNWKKLASEIISLITEWIPFLSFIPSVIAATIVIIFISRFEDKTGIKLSPGKITKGITSARKSAPLNSDKGIRKPRQQNTYTEEIS